MNDMQTEWKMYTKRNILERLYNKNRDQIITDFLKNCDLLKINILNKNEYEIEVEIQFKKENEMLKIVGQLQLWDRIFFWFLPEKYELMELQEILDRFNFDRYIEYY
jgi:hypothetical protein